MKITFKDILEFLDKWNNMDQPGRVLLVKSVKEIIAENKADTLQALRDGRCKAK